ncbi:formylglycine-generating enzyme family protein [Sunxiuqinia rutila]|uniref:formylglycine-generating enzyme family protein n=1 Tax=Sunxiuqinia rutila TaxID=1397841 RepID=UPI003D363DAF
MQIQLATIAITGCLIASCSNSSSNSKQATNQAPESPKQELAQVAEQATPDFTNMVQFPAGSYFIGSDKGLPNEQPVHAVDLNAFYIDQSPVTVAQFRQFIEATGYKTEAEKFGDSGVFNFTTNQWELKKGTNWEYPLGPDHDKATNNHPVTHVSWNDAKAYASWAGKRLPTEAEWEVAARSGKNNQQRFSWGDQLVKNGQYKANVWQGDEVNHNSNEDGYQLTSPVGAFGKNEAGLTDMGGNVWNWCADTYQLYPGNSMPFRKDENVKVIRGGSFFFDQNGEASFTVSGRSFNSHETSLFNTGFRCAADVK